MIKVSIVIPVYNVEKYLEKCLESLIHQTLKDIEIICINDGSTDNSLSILKKYKEKDGRIRIIDKENGGVSRVRNLGIEIAKGEYIGFIDSDDWVSLDFFEKLYEAAKRTGADIAAAGMIKIKARCENGPKRTLLKFSKEITADDTDKKFEICNIPDYCYTCNKIYKLSEIKKHDLKFKNDVLYEDIFYTPKAVHKLGKLVAVPDTYYFYYKRQGSITNTRRNTKDHLIAYNAACRYFKEINIDMDYHSTKIKRYKLFGQTVFKTKSKGDKRECILFNVIKWKMKRRA